MAEVAQRSLKTNRTVLHKVIPIDTPFLLGIFVGDICNFKCRYCIQSAEDTVPEKQTLVKQFLRWDTFVKIADAATEFPQKIKTVLFSSIGEPLLHPQLPDMIRYLKELQLANAYEIVTNASLLSPELGKCLVDAGLTRLCISLQGLSATKYQEICGVRINYQQLYNNIKEFYEYSRNRCKLHIKTVDIALDPGEEKLFFDQYASICDTIHIDQVVPAFQGVDYKDILIDAESYSQNIYRANEKVCCPKIFYTLYTLADGRIAPCCDHPQPMIYGHINQMSLIDAWNGKKRKDFLIQHLEHRRCENGVCRKCVTPLEQGFREDLLDGFERELLGRL